jgi:hypothetical protein
VLCRVPGSSVPAGRLGAAALPRAGGAWKAVTQERVSLATDATVHAETRCALLRKIAALGWQGPIARVLDNARYPHGARALDLARSWNGQLQFLPADSPKRNGIERWWKFVQKQVLDGHQDPTCAEFRAAIDGRLAQIPTEPITPNFQTFSPLPHSWPREVYADYVRQDRWTGRRGIVAAFVAFVADIPRIGAGAEFPTGDGDEVVGQHAQRRPTPLRRSDRDGIRPSLGRAARGNRRRGKRRSREPPRVAGNRGRQRNCWMAKMFRETPRFPVAKRINVYGSVWESNPLRALFKPAAGFEDRGPHQRCKHSRRFVVGPRKRAIPAIPIVHGLLRRCPCAARGSAISAEIAGNSRAGPRKAGKIGQCAIDICRNPF